MRDLSQERSETNNHAKYISQTKLTTTTSILKSYHIMRLLSLPSSYEALHKFTPKRRHIQTSKRAFFPRLFAQQPPRTLLDQHQLTDRKWSVHQQGLSPSEIASNIIRKRYQSPGHLLRILSAEFPTSPSWSQKTQLPA